MSILCAYSVTNFKALVKQLYSLQILTDSASLVVTLHLTTFQDLPGEACKKVIYTLLLPATALIPLLGLRHSACLSLLLCRDALHWFQNSKPQQHQR